MRSLILLEDLLGGWSWSAHWNWLWSSSWESGVAWDHLDSWGVSAEAGGGSHIWSEDWVLPEADDSWLGLLKNNLLWLLAVIKADLAGSVGVSSALSISVTSASGVSSIDSLTSLAWLLSKLSISPLLTLGEIVSSERSEESVVAVLPSGISSSDSWLWLDALGLLVSAGLSASESAVSAIGLAVSSLSGEGAGLSTEGISTISASATAISATSTAHSVDSTSASASSAGSWS